MIDLKYEKLFKQINLDNYAIQVGKWNVGAETWGVDTRKIAIFTFVIGFSLNSFIDVNI